MTKALKCFEFSVEGRYREVRSFRRAPAGGMTCEVRLTPGSLVVWADTPSEALRLLADRLDNAVRRAGGVESFLEPESKAPR